METAGVKRELRALLRRFVVDVFSWREGGLADDTYLIEMES